VSGSKKGHEIDETLERAKIVNEGVMTSEHSWLAPRVEGWRNTQAGSSRPTSPSTNVAGAVKSSIMKDKRKKVLLLGSGLVAGPAVDVFVSRGDVELVIGMSSSQ
jgi:alpha-aminoadipic semialdehyde synthase